MIQEEYKIKAQEISNLLVTPFIKSSQIFIVNKLYSKNYACILSIITEWTQTDEGKESPHMESSTMATRWVTMTTIGEEINYQDRVI